MTASIIHFSPRAEQSAKANLDDLISLCRSSRVLGADEHFDEDVWPAPHRKGKSGTQQRIVFSTLEAAGKRPARRLPALPEPFLSFAKAVIVYLDDLRPVVSHGNRLGALRCLHAALEAHGKGGRPTAVNGAILDAAVEIAKNRLSVAAAYGTSGQLELIANVLRDAGIFELRTEWVHSAPRPNDHGSRISKEALEARHEKLPSVATLRALGGIFHEATGEADNIIISTVALMMCAPERVNEVLRLRSNCLVEGEGRFEGRLGIRWPGSKGADDTTKWLPTEMAPTGREALKRLEAVTARAREVAKWYTENPTSLYLHEGAQHLRGSEFVSLQDVVNILHGEEGIRQSVGDWLKRTGVKPVRRGTYRLADVETAVLAMLPATFPHVPGDPSLRYCDALTVVLRRQFSNHHVTWLCAIEALDQGDIAARLGPRNETGITSIFERYNYKEEDGSPIVVTTHAFRHYLNTLAQVGGMTDAEIAIFSGRKDIRQNRRYDHSTSDQVQEPISRAIAGGFTGDLVAPETKRTLWLRSEFSSLGARAAHTTAYGYCLHDFAASPCTLNRDCLNCDEQECVKGEAHKEANLRQQKEETVYLLAQARAALTDEEYGADLWVDDHTKTLARINALLSVYDDPGVAPGARVRLSTDGLPFVENAGVAVALNSGRNYAG